jgi:hypothetical protein
MNVSYLTMVPGSYASRYGSSLPTKLQNDAGEGRQRTDYENDTDCHF